MHVCRCGSKRSCTPWDSKNWGKQLSAAKESSQGHPSGTVSRNCCQEQNPWRSHSIHTTSLGRLWRSSKGVSSVLVSTFRITTSSRAMLLTFCMWANSGEGKGKCNYGTFNFMHKEHKWWQNNMALQNLNHFKNNQHSRLPVIICFICSFYNAKKLTFSWQREVLKTYTLKFVKPEGLLLFKQRFISSTSTNVCLGVLFAHLTVSSQVRISSKSFLFGNSFK